MNSYEATEIAYKNGYEAGKPKWIPVTEGLPELDERVMMAGKRGAVFIGRNIGETWAMSDGTTRRFTHWMPLPEAPKGD